MREIGSEFWEVPVTRQENRLFPEKTQWFLSGRSALAEIIKRIKEKDGCCTISIPAWCCDSMIKPFSDAGIEISFYPVWFDQKLHQEIRCDHDALFVMDYFGYTPAPIELNRYQGIIIRDVTHSIFSTAYTDADYYFGSLRKWCGFWTGGFAWAGDGHCLPEGTSGNEEYVSLRKQAMEMKDAYIRGETKEKAFLHTFEKAEELLEKANIQTAAKRDVRLAQKLDAEFIKKARRTNAEVLREAFPDWLLFPEMSASDCPMFVPVLIPDNKRDDLRKYLIHHSIYCPVHWPISKYHQLSARERVIYENELSLVCDQRYTAEDMDRVVNTIKQFMEA